MRHQWDQRGGSVSARQVIDKLLLWQSGHFLGDSVTEQVLVNEVANLWRLNAQRQCTGGLKKRRVGDKPARDDVVADAAGSGAFTLLDSMQLANAGNLGRQAFLRKRRAKGRPLDLPNVLETSVTNALDKDGAVKPLPVDIRTLHAQQKGFAESSLKQLMQTWLQSDQGFPQKGREINKTK